jgi:hypothetical protein
MARRSPLEPGRGPGRGKRVNKRGPKTRAWERVRRALKVEFTAMGIQTCELRFPGCLFDDNLSFAHRMKRRFITTDEEMRVVILCCVPCHTTIELQSHATMRNVVDKTIAGRAT